MAEERISDTGKEVTQAEDTTAGYLDAIKDLKANSVSRADYDKLKSENKQLLETIVHGSSVENEPVDTRDSKDVINDLRNALYSSNTDMTNLEYITKTLQLREELIKEGNADPFEAGNNGVSSPKDFVNGADVAERLQEIVDKADGDPIRFNAEYKRMVEPIKHITSK